MSQTLKQILINSIDNQLNIHLKNLEKEIKLLQTSANEETKSSAGDKYETGRAMAQNEIEKLQVQLGGIKSQLLKLLQINFEQRSEFVTVGSLIETQFSSILIAIGFGQLEIENKKYWIVSPVSPVGKSLIGKKLDDEVQVFGVKSRIINIQ